jgi:hypothetical protein
VILTETLTSEAASPDINRRVIELIDSRIELLVPAIGKSACGGVNLGPRQLAYLQHWGKSEWWLLLSEHSSEASAHAPYGEGERHIDRLYHRSTDKAGDLLITAVREGVGDLWMDSFANFDCRTISADPESINHLLSVLGVADALPSAEVC